jgi:hypothetical protein
MSCTRHLTHSVTFNRTPFLPAKQARGRTLLNLRVSDAEGGLLGRTLLTLVPNKGFGSTPAVPLPAHKFSPHDVVALKASSAGLGGPPLCTGLVCRWGFGNMQSMLGIGVLVLMTDCQ